MANTIPFDQVCPYVSSGLYRVVVVGALGDTCGVPLNSATDVPHLSPPGVGFTNIVFGDLQQSFACDAGATGPSGVNLSQAVTPIPTALASSAASISAGRMRYDGAKAYQCRQLGLAAQLDAGSVPQVCAEILVGLVSPGGACATSDECFDGGFCQPAARDSCLGTCVARLATGTACEVGRDVCSGSCSQVGITYECVDKTAPIPPGQPCPIHGNELCDHGTCIPMANSDAGVCAANALHGQPCGIGTDGRPGCADPCDRCTLVDGGAPQCLSGAIGSACRASTDCVLFTWCEVPAGADAGTCIVKPRLGEACVPSSPGQAGNCMWGDTFCQVASSASVCALLPQLGDACGTTADRSTSCRHGTYCDVDAGRCLANPGLGQACGYGPTAGAVCASPLSCDAGVCVAYPAAGMACVSKQCGVAAFCDSDAGICRDLLPSGSPCTDDTQCVGTLCSTLDQKCTTACNTVVAASGSACGCSGRGLLPMIFFAALALQARRRTPTLQRLALAPGRVRRGAAWRPTRLLRRSLRRPRLPRHGRR
jgi:hypothetical protein